MSRRTVYTILAVISLACTVTIGALFVLSYGHFDEQKMELTEVHLALQPTLDDLGAKLQERSHLKPPSPIRTLAQLHLSHGRTATITVANESVVIARHSSGALIVYFPDVQDGKLRWVCTGEPRNHIPLPCR